MDGTSTAPTPIRTVAGCVLPPTLQSPLITRAAQHQRARTSERGLAIASLTGRPPRERLLAPTPIDGERPSGIRIRVRDEGPGFDPEALPDPLAPENMLKSSGRGIFLIRSFMDELVLRRAPEGGMEVAMVKRVSAEFLQNANE